MSYYRVFALNFNTITNGGDMVSPSYMAYRLQTKIVVDSISESLSSTTFLLSLSEMLRTAPSFKTSPSSPSTFLSVKKEKSTPVMYVRCP